MYAGVKTRSDVITVKIVTKKSDGVISGSVTPKKRRTGLAPSSEAASRRSWEMPWSAARKMIILVPPTVDHQSMKTSDGRAQWELDNQVGPLIPIRCRR